MRIRYFRTAAGWLQDVNTADPEFSVEMQAHEAGLSEAYGLSVTGVEQDGDEPDPRREPYVAAPDVALPAFPELVATAAQPTLTELILTSPDFASLQAALKGG